MLFLEFIRKIRPIFRKSVLPVIVVALLLNIVFGVAFYFAEKGAQEISLLDSLWWAMVTMTTVGYGDYYAKTEIGRFLISYPCMLIGIGIIGYLVGAVANAMINIALRKRKGLMDISYKNHILICNYPSSEKVLRIVDELRLHPDYKSSPIVLVSETIDELPEELHNAHLYFVAGSPTQEDILMKANVLECAGVIVLAEDASDIRSDERTYMIGSIIELIEQEKKISIKTIIELVSMSNVRSIERADVDGYFTADGLSGCMLVQEFANPGINKVISQVVSNSRGSQFYIHETRLFGTAIRDIQIGALKHDINLQVVGLVREGKNILNPATSTVFESCDKLLVLAESPHQFEVVENAIDS